MQEFVNIIPISAAEGVTQVSKQRFVIYPALKQQRYVDLDLFRQQIEESKAGLHHQPYTAKKKVTRRYQVIFFSIAILFFILTVTTITIPSALGCGFLFSSCSLLKGILASIAACFSLSAMLLALTIKTEKEAITALVRKAKTHLAAIYARKQTRLGVKRFFFFFAMNKTAVALKQMYQETYDLMNDKREEALHLAHRIATAETLEAQEKEDLLNQSIEELHDKLQYLLHSFRHAMPASPGDEVGRKVLL